MPDPTDLIRRADAITAAAKVEQPPYPRSDAGEAAIYAIGFTAGRKAVEVALRALPAITPQEPPSPGVTAGATGADDDPSCTDCGGAGITYQTERRCACQGPEEAWLIHKAGRGWYRPEARGYTGNPAEAGRYSYEDAYSHSHPNGESAPRDGITIKRASTVLATPAPVVPAEGLEALLAAAQTILDRGYVSKSIPEEKPDHDALQSAITALRSAPPVGARVTDAARDVLAERSRQTEVEGWSAEHDDCHDRSELAQAAACYALSGTPVDEALFIHGKWKDKIDLFWPFCRSWFRPTNRRRDLVKAGALILAEIERLDRAAALLPAGEGE